MDGKLPRRCFVGLAISGQHLRAKRGTFCGCTEWKPGQWSSLSQGEAGKGHKNWWALEWMMCCPWLQTKGPKSSGNLLSGQQALDDSGFNFWYGWGEASLLTFLPQRNFFHMVEVMVVAVTTDDSCLWQLTDINKGRGFWRLLPTYTLNKANILANKVSHLSQIFDKLTASRDTYFF